MNGRSSKEPTNVDYVPTIFKDRKRHPSAPTDDSDRSRRLAKRIKTCKEAKEVRDCAQALLDLSVSDSTALVKEEEVGSILNDSVMEDNVLLAKQVHALRQQVLESSTVSRPSPSMLNLIETKDSKTRFYTGLPNYEVFRALVTYFEPKVIRARLWQGRRTRDADNDTEMVRRSKLSVAEELLAVLMHLRLGLLLQDIADRFNVSASTMSRIFTTWLRLLSVELRQMFPWPTRDLVAQYTPKQFSKYPNTRVIIDCTELYIQWPSSLVSQSETFSNYKHHNTFKVLVGITPGGVVSFVSELWGGRVSDKAITSKCGIIESGDNVMADRGFEIQELLEPKGVNLNIPPFLGKRKQLTSREVTETRRIAELCIHMERAIGRIKSYRILQGVMPLSPASQANDIFTVCAFLTNFLPPVVNSK